MPEQVPAAYQRTFRILSSRPELTDRYDEVILKYSRQYQIDPRLLKAIMAAESEFYRRALSPAGARGLMQVMPSTAEEMGVPREYLYDPEYNIRAGASYLAHLFERAVRKFRLRDTNFMHAPLWLVQRVLAAYHAGPRFLTADRWYRQTRNYIRKVLLFHRSKVSDFQRSTWF
jgi:soluble lytic murein transglycosylase-like protein